MREYNVAEVLAEADRTADWRRVRALYGQYRNLVANGAGADMVNDVLAALGQEVGRLAPSCVGRDGLLAAHALAVFADVAGHEALDPGTFQSFYRDPPFESYLGAHRTKRRPSPFEAVVETCRRLRDAESLRQVLRGIDCSGMLCGSVCHGPHFSVRGNNGEEAGSDLDVLLVARRTSDLSAMCTAIGRLPGVAAADVQSLRQRSAAFAAMYDDDRTALSHKLTMWTEPGSDALLLDPDASPTYKLSLHVLTLPALDYVLVESSASMVKESAGTRRTIRDFRDQNTDRVDVQWTFAGHRLELNPDVRQVADGYLRCTGAYSIDDGDHYSPGFMQVLMLPDFDLRWDHAEIRPRLETFRRKFTERLRYERQADQFTQLRPSYTHPRRGVFAPHLIGRFDREYSPS